MGFCLVKHLADEFKKAIKDGRINPETLTTMTSAERRTLFESIVGEHGAEKVNALFEKTLLLKDQQRGMINWAKKVSGISPEVRADMISRIQKMDKVLTPENESAFLEDLAASRLGTRITFEEAKVISDLSAKLKETKDNIKTDRLSYGAARVNLENYMLEVKRAAQKITLQGLKENPRATVIEATSRIAGTAKSLKATLDNSAVFRQGWRTVFTHPDIWAKSAVQSFIDIYHQLKVKVGDDGVLNGIKAEILSRNNAVDGTYAKMKLDIGTSEEAYPSSLPEKIPGFGRIFKASEVAYTGFLYRLRADIADRYIELAKKQGVDIQDPKQVQGIGRLVNSLTGRGNLGKFEHIGRTVNTVFFSPKNVKSHFDFLTAHALEDVGGFAKKQAALNLARVIAGTSAILATAYAINKDSVELDPRSADFGKIKIGDTRFDVTGGMGSLLTLAARQVLNSTKSSTTGKVYELGNKFGQQNRIDVLLSYLGNKLSPAAGFLRDIFRGTDFNGKPITAAGEFANTFVPLPITTGSELLNDPKSAPFVLAILLDALGISTNTYPSKKK